jgi:hypothetical protein
MPAARVLRRIARRAPGARAAYRAQYRARRELNAFAYWMRDRGALLLGRGRAADALARQAVLRSSAPLDARPVLDLEAALTAAGARCEAGPGAVYVPPQPNLRRVLGDAVMRYPSDAAFRFPTEAPAGSADLADALRAANLLYARDMGPRLFDACTLELEGGFVTAFVVAHAGESPAPPAQASALADELTELVDAGELTAPGAGWSDPANFRASSADCRYVGFEHLRAPRGSRHLKQLVDRGARRDMHFGSEFVLRGGRYLYQSVPSAGAAGRRDSPRRWRMLSSLLGSTGEGVAGRVVLDVGCNAGMMLGAALGEGAEWGLGWDVPSVIARARPLLRGLGFTRFDMFGCDLTPDYPLSADVPSHIAARLEGCVVLYLAIRHHVGFLRELATVPWRTIVYEGGEEESTATLDDDLAELRAMCGFRVAEAVDFRDSETARRPLAILQRS